MRLLLVLRVTPFKNVIPLNYQYPVSAWIYQRMSLANRKFTDWLHDQGYQILNKNFKLFTFSSFNVPQRKITGDRLHILGSQVSLQLSFHVDKAAESFIIGLFQNQEFEIGDRISKAKFLVETIESLPVPEFRPEMEFRCLSPICVSRTVIRKGKKMPEYLSPEHPEFERIFFDNLIFKYVAARNGVSVEEEKNRYESPQFKLTVLGEPKSRLITIKTGQPQQTRVRGYFFPFKITAPRELIQFGYQAGFGEKNSLGFGCVEVNECFKD